MRYGIETDTEGSLVAINIQKHAAQAHAKVDFKEDVKDEIPSG